MRLPVENIVRLGFLALLLLLAAGSASHMLLMENSYLVTAYNRYFIILAFLAWGAAAVILCVTPGCRIYTAPFTIAAYILYLLWIIIPTLLVTTSAQESLASKMSYTWTPLLTLVVAYTVARNYGHSKSWQLGFLFLGFVCAVQFVRVMFDFSAITEESHLVCAYFVMYALPLMLLVKSKLLRILLSLAVLMVIFASFKRGGLVALVLGLVAYLVTLQFIANKISMGSILIGVSVLAMFAVILVILGTTGESTVFDRFQTSNNDTGSGRTLVWPVTLGMIENSDAIGLLFGHGSGAVQADSPIMLSAHNDFLEITYDYGLVGVVLYTFAFVSLGFYILRMIHQKSAYAPSMVLLYAVYGVLSLISHVAIYYWMSVVMMTVGYCIGCHKHDASLSAELLETSETNHAGNK